MLNKRKTDGRRAARGALVSLLTAVLLAGCDAAPARSAPVQFRQAFSDADFAALVDRISEPAGYFDTDNLISNESGYLTVMDALAKTGIEGGAYVGVGPDRTWCYPKPFEQPGELISAERLAGPAVFGPWATLKGVQCID